jgi:hypothetical protein
MAVANPTEKKTFGNLFTPTRKNRTTTAPRQSSGWVEDDFDRMLHRERTKKVTLSHIETPSTSLQNPSSPMKLQRKWSTAREDVKALRKTDRFSGKNPAQVGSGRELDFEIASASGVGIYDGMDDRTEDKWMGE